MWELNTVFTFALDSELKYIDVLEPWKSCWISGNSTMNDTSFKSLLARLIIICTGCKNNKQDVKTS